MATTARPKARRRPRGPRNYPNPPIPLDVRQRNRATPDELGLMSKPELRRRRRQGLETARYQRNAVKAYRRGQR